MTDVLTAPKKRRRRSGDEFPKLVEELAPDPGKREAHVWDPLKPGFGVRAYGSGQKSYVVKYQLPTGGQRKVVLGSVRLKAGKLDLEALEENRRQAETIREDARKGIDYVAEIEKRREDAIQREKTEKPLKDLINSYLATKKTQVRPSTYREIEHHLLKLYAPLHERAVATIGRRDIVEIVDGLVAKGHVVQADRAKTNATTFFSWLIERDYITANPASGIRRRTPKEKLQRDRVMSLAELATIWRAVDGHSDYENIIRLLLLTGARREEIGALQWDEIDFGKAHINLPKERTKNGVPHTIFLSEPALEILRSVTQRRGKRTLFGMTSAPFGGWSKCKVRLDEKLGKEFKPWVVHDLRRSLATNASDLGLASIVTIEMALGHWSGEKRGIVKVYNRSTHDAERRKLADDWAERVLAHVR